MDLDGGTGNRCGNLCARCFPQTRTGNKEGIDIMPTGRDSHTMTGCDGTQGDIRDKG